ncbi:MAG TPA: DUF2069 domain-containing protein [Nevskiaceae bacterium]
MLRSPSRAAWLAALVLQAGLVAGLVWWAGWIAGALLSAPLLLTLPGLLRRRPRPAVWCAYLMVIYFAGLLSEAYTLPARYVPGLALTGVVLLAFFSLLLFVRWSARERRANSTARAGRKGSSAGAGR